MEGGGGVTAFGYRIDFSFLAIDSRDVLRSLTSHDRYSSPLDRHLDLEENAVTDAVILAELHAQLPQRRRRLLTFSLRRRPVAREAVEEPREERHPQVVRQPLVQAEQRRHLHTLEGHVQRTGLDRPDRRAFHRAQRALRRVKRKRARHCAKNNVVVAPHVARHEPRVRGDELDRVVRELGVHPAL